MSAVNLESKKSVGSERKTASKNMDVSYSNIVQEENLSLMAKEEKLLPGICIPNEERIKDEIERAAEDLKKDSMQDAKHDSNSSEVANGGSQDSTNADMKYHRKINHNFAVTLNEAKAILGSKTRGRTRSQDRSRSLKRRSAVSSLDSRRPNPGNAALKRKRR